MKKAKPRLKIAIQKSGRLNSDSLDLLTQCGFKIRFNQGALLCHCENLPIDILFVRDNDIPTLVMDGVCDLGIIGENVLFENAIQYKKNNPERTFVTVKKLGFGRCRLSIALPNDKSFSGPNSLQELRIATSYPQLLQQYLSDQKIQALVITLSGSVEIAPKLGMADAICDLVSTGRTLEENNLHEVATVIQSEAVLIKTADEISPEKNEIFELLLRRMDGVLKAQGSKYIMFHVPRAALQHIKQILPGCEAPTIMPLEGSQDKVAVHVVSSEGVFWSTLEKLKQIGASSILVLPIEKMLS